jgi:hypothetical protein
MDQQEALALAVEVECQPAEDWLAEAFEGVNGRWYLVAARTADPATHFVLRHRRDWERVLDLLADA